MSACACVRGFYGLLSINNFVYGRMWVCSLWGCRFLFPLLSKLEIKESARFCFVWDDERQGSDASVYILCLVMATPLVEGWLATSRCIFRMLSFMGLLLITPFTASLKLSFFSCSLIIGSRVDLKALGLYE